MTRACTVPGTPCREDRSDSDEEAGISADDEDEVLSLAVAGMAVEAKESDGDYSQLPVPPASLEEDISTTRELAKRTELDYVLANRKGTSTGQ